MICAELIRAASVGAVLVIALGSCATAETITDGEYAGSSGAGGGSKKGGSAGQAGNGGTPNVGGAGGATAGSGGTAGGSGGASGGSGGATGGSGGATGGSGGATGGSGGATGGSGGTGGGSGCEIGTGEAACDACINAQCEASCMACQNNPECLALLDCIGACPAGSSTCQSSCNAQHPGGTNDAIAFFGSQTGCVKLNCDTQCGGGGGTLPAGCYTAGTPACNPLTNAGCAADEACDISPSGLKCFPGPNTAGLGEDCDYEYCQATLTCDPMSRCTNICCSDDDCQGLTTCVPFSVSQFGMLGGCL